MSGTNCFTGPASLVVRKAQYIFFFKSTKILKKLDGTGMGDSGAPVGRALEHETVGPVVLLLALPEKLPIHVSVPLAKMGPDIMRHSLSMA